MIAYFLYNACLFAYFLIAGPYYLLHVLLREHYRAGLLQRLGFVPFRPSTEPVLSLPKDSGRTGNQDERNNLRVWFHGVSVGEIQTLMDLGEKLRQALRHGSGQVLPSLDPVYST